MPGTETDHDLRARLRAELASWGVRLDPDAPDESPLIGSGALDSLALFRLALWIEQELGRPVDPGAFDIATEWDSVSRVVSFVRARRAADGR